MGDRAGAIHQGGHAASTGRSTGHGRRRTREYIYKRVYGYVPDVRAARPSTRSAAKTVRATSPGEIAVGPGGNGASKQSRVRSARVVGRLPRGLGRDQFREPHSIHVANAPQFRGASEGGHSAGTARVADEDE